SCEAFHDPRFSSRKIFAKCLYEVLDFLWCRRDARWIAGEGDFGRSDQRTSMPWHYEHRAAVARLDVINTALRWRVEHEVGALHQIDGEAGRARCNAREHVVCP